MIAKVPLRGLVKRNVLSFIEKMYTADPGAAGLATASGTDDPAPADVDAAEDVPPILRTVLRAWARFQNRG